MSFTYKESYLVFQNHWTFTNGKLRPGDAALNLGNKCQYNLNVFVVITGPWRVLSIVKILLESFNSNEVSK
jgi:hypothetical protein